jgi:hypothetical protein
MSSTRTMLVWVILFSLLLTACGSGVAASNPIDSNAVSTSLVSTLVASMFQTRTALAPPTASFPTSAPTPVTFPTIAIPTSTYLVYFPTLTTPFATYTPTVTGTVFTPTVDPNSLASGCNNMAFVRDVTIPAGTVLKPNQDFTKTWKVANIGTCDWTYQYALVFLSGNSFSGKTTKINRVVTVGHWAEVSVDMGAPHPFGAYTSYWRMQDGAGKMFGSTLPISIVVGVDSTDTPVPSTNTSAPTNTPVPTSTSVPTDTSTPEPTATTSTP